MKIFRNIMARRVNSASAGMRAVLWTIFIAMASLTVVALAQDTENGGKDPTALSGTPAPGFALTNLSGKTVRLLDFKGQVVLVDFWATWCPPCRGEIPDFVQLQKQYAGKGFTVLGIALDDQGAVVVKPLAQKLHINYPVVIGNSQVAAAYGGIQALPTAFLISRNGKILKSFVGARDKSQWEQIIQTALGQN